MSYQVAECRLPGQQHRSCLCTLGALASARLGLEGYSFKVRADLTVSAKPALQGQDPLCPQNSSPQGREPLSGPPGTDGDVQSYPDSRGALTWDSEP